MAYDLVRWAIGIVIFVPLLLILIKTTSNKSKSALISAFAAIITSAILLLVPVENIFVSFKTVEKVYSYRHHEELLTFAECDEGALCVGKKDEGDYVFYSFNKSAKGYKLPKFGEDTPSFRSSKFGIYTFKRFRNQMLIITQAEGSSYDGHAFSKCSLGYYTYTVIDGDFNYSLLSCGGEKVVLI